MNLGEYLPKVEGYLQRLGDDNLLFWRQGHPYKVKPLAQGEYNMNYLVQQSELPAWVLRVNLGSQINRSDQIVYEYKTLVMLAESGHTPLPLFVDDSREYLDHGVLGMTYLSGEPLQYEHHRLKAAELFANIHSYSAKCNQDHLIVESYPLTMTYGECKRLLKAYFDSPLADEAIKAYLVEILAWADEYRRNEVFYQQDPWPCVINTEVNSSNFIISPCGCNICLVDWEKPLWGDPSQDISHFCVPTTTLWKTDYRMVKEEKQEFLDVYCAKISDRHLRDTIHERVRLRDPFNCLRGISWSAWAWVAYQTGEAVLRNQDTFLKLCQYMNLSFIRGLFAPYMKAV